MAHISIGHKVTVGPDVKFLGGNHDLTFMGGHIWDNSQHSALSRGIVIEDGVWIGSNALILDGAFIGEGTVIGAGSVVTGNLKPWSVYAGTPARFIRYRFPNTNDLVGFVLESVDSHYCISDIIS